MAVENISIVVDPDKKFQALIERAGKVTGDLTIPFTLITKDWFKSNKAIFSLKGKGKYADLSPAYKKQKMRAVKFIYPILKRSGLLATSLTEAGSTGSVSEIFTTPSGQGLLLGTRVTNKEGAPYPIYLQRGTLNEDKSVKMPARPFVFIGAEQTDDKLNRRREAWVKIFEKHIQDFLDRENR